MRLLSSMLLCFLSVGLVIAQPPGGGPAGGGGTVGDGEIINPDVPDIDDIELESQGDIDIDPSFQNRGATLAVDLDTTAIDRETPFDAMTFDSRMDSYEVPDDWSQIDIRSDMPNAGEIELMRDEFPDDIDIDALDIQAESDPESTNAILGYANSVLGTNVSVIYAGEYNDSDLASNPEAQGTISQIYSELDPDMQALMTEADSLSGVTYWALLIDGYGLLYTGDCDIEQCTIQQDAVQIEVTSGSAGAYAIYSDTIPSTSDEAKALIHSTYPYLASIELSETESDYGTAFFAFDVDISNGDVTAYYAGVYASDAGQSIVYVVSGVGDAYINMLLGG